MTTVIGIQADEGIVLFADTQVSPYGRDDEKLPEPYQKIKVLGEYCAFAVSGVFRQYNLLREFFGCGSLASARRLNEKLKDRLVYRYSASIGSASMLIALRVDRPVLYRVCSSRNVTRLQRRYVALGSGAEYAERFLDNNLNGNCSIEHALSAGYDAMRYAFHDINTGGFVDYVVIMADRIDIEGISAHKKVHKKVLGLERALITATRKRYRR